MLTRNERWMLAGAWVLILACGAGGVILIETAERAPLPMAFERSREGSGRFPRPPTPPPTSSVLEPWNKVIAPVREPVTPYIGWLIPEIRLKPEPPPPGESLLLPALIYSGTLATDRVLLTWEIREPKPQIGRRVAPPQAVLVHRECEGEEVQQIAVLDPKAVSFEDREVLQGRSYRYWVILRGDEGEKTYKGDLRVSRSEREGTGAVEVRIPEWHKVRLLGGDKDHAILSVDSYNRGKGRWENRMVQATPGQKIGATGWTVERLRFDKFTLVVEVTDDRGATREIRTQ